MKGFSTRILDDAVRRRRRLGEESRRAYLKKVFSALDELSRDIPFDKAYVFGSLMKPGKFGGESDIDIGFLGLKDEDCIGAMARLSRALGHEVDVVQMEGHRFEAAIKGGIEWKRGRSPS